VLKCVESKSIVSRVKSRGFGGPFCVRDVVLANLCECGTNM